MSALGSNETGTEEDVVVLSAEKLRELEAITNPWVRMAKDPTIDNDHLFDRMVYNWETLSNIAGFLVGFNFIVASQDPEFTYGGNKLKSAFGMVFLFRLFDVFTCLFQLLIRWKQLLWHCHL